MNNNANKKKIQSLRENYIRELNNVGNEDIKIQYAENLFTLDLTVYSKDYTLDSIIYNSFAKSSLDDSISLHPEQLNFVNLIKSNVATIISAPTSFGKTYSIFEYITLEEPNNIVLVVPTLALVEEYMQKIIKKYKKFFSKYKVYTQLGNEDLFSNNKKNIFILTHDKVVNSNVYKTFKSIDFLVIDEVYKLAKDISDDRILILNMAYYYLSKIAKKYVLLAPFIKNIEDLNELEKKPNFYSTDYSPVVNDVITINVKDDYRYLYLYYN